MQSRLEERFPREKVKKGKSTEKQPKKPPASLIPLQKQIFPTLLPRSPWLLSFTITPNPKLQPLYSLNPYTRKAILYFFSLVFYAHDA